MSFTEHLQNNIHHVQSELLAASTAKNEFKDILIVVKDQLPYLRACVDSIFNNTSNFNLYVWDNDSSAETRAYLQKLTLRNNVFLHLNKRNDGFLSPNNRLAEKTVSPYLILLNSDTEVKPQWDLVMLGWMQQHNTSIVGYGGVKLNQECKGYAAAFGTAADFISGWSLCFARSTYEKIGLFDEQNLKFAYGEDADFSLRCKEAGGSIYALYSGLVIHHQNKTSLEMSKDPEYLRWFSTIFEENHAYLRQRWMGKIGS